MKPRGKRSAWNFCVSLLVGACHLIFCAGLQAWAAFGTRTAEVPDILFVFNIQSGAETHISIQTRFRGGPAGFTVLGLCLNHWAGSENCDHNITGLQVTSQLTGMPLHNEHPQPNIWIADHAPGEPIVVTYGLQSAPDEQPFALRATRNHVLFFGNTTLIVPEHLVSLGDVNIQYEWQGTLIPGAHAISSFSQDKVRDTVRLPLIGFLESVFFIGSDYEAHLLQASDGTPLSIVWLAQQPNGQGRWRAERRLPLIYRAIDAYFNNRKLGNSLVWFFLPKAGGATVAITLTSSFVIFTELKVKSGEAQEDQILHELTLAHELVHMTPEGRVMITGLENGPLSFAEAFSEFVARRSLARNGLISASAWAELISEKLAKYKSDKRNPSVGDRRSSGDRAYVLGDLVLVLIDSEIRKKSAGARDILDFSQALIAKGHRIGMNTEVDWTSFCDALVRMTSPAFAIAIAEILQDKRELTLPTEIFRDCADVIKVPLWGFDVGFDLNHSLSAHKILGVRQDSAAWKAGLRDGQDLFGWDIVLDRPQVTASIDVAVDGVKRRVTYLPRSSESIGETQALQLEPNGSCRGSF